jgi:glycosyltransferase involved in cell wall biosynthesis
MAGVDRATPLIGTVALLRPRKGIDDFLHAASLVVRSEPSARFVIAGRFETPAYETCMRRLVHELSLTDHIYFLGYRADVPDLLAALDVFVLPSLFGEGAPFALLEAMAASRPVIATRTEGNTEIIEDGRTGLLVPQNHPESMARAILHLLAGDSIRHELGARARNAVLERFHAETMTEKTEAFYSQILAERSFRYKRSYVSR